MTVGDERARVMGWKVEWDRDCGTAVCHECGGDFLDEPDRFPKTLTGFYVLVLDHLRKVHPIEAEQNPGQMPLPAMPIKEAK